jgi:hypothetical protein
VGNKDNKGQVVSAQFILETAVKDKAAVRVRNADVPLLRLAAISSDFVFAPFYAASLSATPSLGLATRPIGLIYSGFIAPKGCSHSNVSWRSPLKLPESLRAYERWLRRIF